MDSKEAQPPNHQQQVQPGMMMMSSFRTNMPNNHNPFAINSNSTSDIMTNPRFPFNSMMSSSSNPFDSFNGNNNNNSSYETPAPPSFNMEQQGKKKRGRPRKYSPDGQISLGISSPPISPTGQKDCTTTPSSSEPSAKRGRGRPPGSGKKQLDALGHGGVGFTPHVITIEPGEEIASKILDFSQGPRTVFILSANGAVSNVTLQQPAMSGGTVSYEGRFDIISLSGSFFPSKSNVSRSRQGGLSVSLASSDGRILGGGVAGMLVAATPIQIILGSFIAEEKKTNSNILTSTSTPPAAAAATSTPSDHGGSSYSSDENGNSPALERTDFGPYNNNSNLNQTIRKMPLHRPPFINWGNSSSMKMHPNSNQS